MKKYSTFLLLLILTNLQTLYAQIIKPNSDTTRCFGITELQYIAATLVDCRKCDTLLAIGKAKLANRDSLVEEQQYSINQLSQQFVLSQKLVILRDQQIKDINLHLKKETRKLKFTKFAWGATTVVLGGALVYFIIN